MFTNALVVIFILYCVKHVSLTDTYKIRNLESDKVCYQTNRIHYEVLSTSPEGLIVKENTYFKNLSGHYALTCRFEVETGYKNQGMFVVIQKLRLRKNPKTQECIDYIRFRPADKGFLSEIARVNLNLKKNKKPWTTYCGDLSARRDGSQVNPEDSDVAETGFLSESSQIEVEIYIDKISTYNESLQLEVLFTPYITCKGSWSGYKECGMNKCIKKQSFDDGLVNCPFLNCPDEGGCDVSIIGNDALPANWRAKVTLTAMTSIFCSFFLFMGCIWCCRHFELLCWSASTLLGIPNPVELSPMRQPSPTAPPPDSAQSKDLPPAYETLFPDRCKDSYIHL